GTSESKDTSASSAITNFSSIITRASSAMTRRAQLSVQTGSHAEACRLGEAPVARKPGMKSYFYRNLTFDTVDDLAQVDSLQQIGPALRTALAKLGFTSLGIGGLPAPSEGANPIILTETTPDGFRAFYIEEQFYLIDHIGAHARTACEPFQFDEAPYESTEA